MNEIIKPLQPQAPGWVRLTDPPSWVTMGFSGQRWWHEKESLCVISAVEVAKDDDGIDRGPEYHVSISLGGKARCTSAQAKRVLADFKCDGAEEDNHVPHGVVRNFWRPVADRFVGMECACKDIEPAIVEDKGDFVWRGVSK